VIIEAGRKTVAHQLKMEAGDPSLEAMIHTWSQAQREALHRLPRHPWEPDGSGSGT
jgi:putative proteasome-type protease